MVRATDSLLHHRSFDPPAVTVELEVGLPVLQVVLLGYRGVYGHFDQGCFHRLHLIDTRPHGVEAQGDLCEVFFPSTLSMSVGHQ